MDERFKVRVIAAARDILCAAKDDAARMFKAFSEHGGADSEIVDELGLQVAVVAYQEGASNELFNALDGVAHQVICPHCRRDEWSPERLESIERALTSMALYYGLCLAAYERVRNDDRTRAELDAFMQEVIREKGSHRMGVK